MTKHPSESYTESVHILNLGNMNGYSRLFGGKLMEWIDINSAVAARRHSGCNVTTVSVRELEFRKPAYANDTLVMTSKVVYTGRTSMEICTKSYVEHLDGTRELINSAYVTMVALGADERPTPVMQIEPETEEEKLEYELAKARREQLKRERG